MASTTSNLAFGNAYSSVQANNINGSVHIGPTNTLARLPHAEDAPFNSYAKQHEPNCLPDTRVDLLREIHDWVDGQDKRCIFWLSGLAGTGKSTIARTIARSYYDKQRLAASFFFSRGGGDVGHAGRFITSLVVQLAGNVSTLKEHIIGAIKEREGIVSQSLRDQWRHLVLGPLLKLSDSDYPAPLVLVVDALDECDSDSNIRIIVQLLAEVRSLTKVQLRVLLTSRPEVHIRHEFCEMPDADHKDIKLHNISRSVVDHDISLFLQHNLQFIARERCLHPGWPGTEIVVQLAQNACGLFIWASTACRFIREGKRFAAKRLEMVLCSKDATPHTPEGHLNDIYTTVLKNSIQDYTDEEKEEQCRAIRSILGSIVVLFSPLSVQSLDQLLDIAEGIRPTLEDLHAILDIPDDQGQPLRLHHPSFRDFLLDQKRCGDNRFYVDEKRAHEKLARRCLELMSLPNGLRQDMCNLSDPGVLQSEINKDIVDCNLSPELQYACRYWVQHLECSGCNIEDGDVTDRFLKTHFLHWLEAMSLMEEASLCVRLVVRLQKLATIYSSGLLFSPDASIVRKLFVEQVPQVTRVVSGRDAEWDACRSVLAAHPHEVTAVVFSPNGQLIASASWGGKVLIWEAATGALCIVLEGRSDWVTAIVFSPNGRLVASAYNDGTVQVWETVTGACRSVLEGHSKQVNAVVFSTDGQLLASASSDHTVRVWEVATGACHRTLKGHSREVEAVVFSLDGQLLASASYDDTVRVQEVATGACRSIRKGHSGQARAAVLSADGQLFVTASKDGTVRVWETATGSCRSVVKSCLRSINEATLSPNGQLVALASNSNGVQVWEIATGACRSVLEGDTYMVERLVFSPDGQLIASAFSEHAIVQIWEVATGACRSVLKGHSNEINAITFSSDGQLIASASEDGTVRVWETATNAYGSSMPEGHFTFINAVTFSPDGQLVASVSEDATVRVWETATGVCRSVLDSDPFASRIAFLPDGRTLSTDKGNISLPEHLTTVPPILQPQESSHITLEGDWILYQTRRFLWLPPEYWICPTAVYRHMIALGCFSGRLVLLSLPQD